MSMRWRVFPSHERALATPGLVVSAARIPRLDTSQLEPMILSRLRTRPPSPSAAARPPQARPASHQGSFLRGSLSTLPPAELLEYLSLLRRPGSLTVRNPDGLEARCEVTEDRLVSASLGKLRDAEAIFELLDWTEGNFELRPVGTPTGVPPAARLAELTMQHARLADELERRSRRLPVADEPLVLRLGRRLPEDQLECGLAQLTTLLEKSPGISRAELEASASHCRLKVRLALALLAEAGCL